ncbi:MAG: hypothetical protein AABZ33_09725 [Chloroflexota bacterium]
MGARSRLLIAAVVMLAACAGPTPEPTTTLAPTATPQPIPSIDNAASTKSCADLTQYLDDATNAFASFDLGGDRAKDLRDASLAIWSLADTVEVDAARHLYRSADALNEAGRVLYSDFDSATSWWGQAHSEAEAALDLLCVLPT